MLQNGSIINGTYEILETIGAGGGGVVYRARHTRLQTDVVLKRIKDEIQGKVNTRQEADVLKKLKHPYLPRVYDFLEQEDGIYTVMDFVPGQSFDKLLRQYHQFPQRRVLKWAIQLGEALSYLHSSTPVIVHADIKPANIILTPEDNICLIDFNIARVIDPDADFVIGISEGYSSPEQYADVAEYRKFLENTRMESAYEATEILADNMDSNDSTELIADCQTEQLSKNQEKYSNEKAERVKYKSLRKIDARSDIYSLGCVLYHFLTGHAPSSKRENIVPISQSSTYISEGLCTIIEKMMEYQPENRYLNGMEYLADIQYCYKLDRRYKQLHRKERGLFILGAIFLLAGAAVIGVGFRDIRIQSVRDYQAKITAADNIAASGDYISAVMMLQSIDEQQTNLMLVERELYYYYQAGQYNIVCDEGIQILDSLVEVSSDEENMDALAGIYYLIANAYYEIGEYTYAKDYIKQVFNYTEGTADYYRDYAVILAKNGELEEASAELNKARNLGLAEDSINFASAEITFEKGEYETAIEFLNKTLKETQDENIRHRASLLYASTLENAGDYEEEIAFLKEILISETSYSLLYKERLAEAYMQLGKQDESRKTSCYEEAIDLFEGVCEQGYGTYQINENIAILKEELKDFSGAKSQLEEMITQYPQQYKVYMRMAYLLADEQQYKDDDERSYGEVKEYYEKAEALYNDQSEVDSEMLMLENLITDIENAGW